MVCVGLCARERQVLSSRVGHGTQRGGTAPRLMTRILEFASAAAGLCEQLPPVSGASTTPDPRGHLPCTRKRMSHDRYVRACAALPPPLQLASAHAPLVAASHACRMHDERARERV